MTGQDSPHSPALRPVEVQRLLHCGRTTVHELAAAGRLLVAGKTPGGHRRYARHSPALLEVLAGQEVTS